MPKSERFYNGTQMICLKSERVQILAFHFTSKIQTKLFGLGLKSSSQTFCLKYEHSVPFLLVRISDDQKWPKSEQNHLDFGQCPNTEPSGIGPKVDRPKSECVWISACSCIITNQITSKMYTKIKIYTVDVRNP